MANPTPDTKSPRDPRIFQAQTQLPIHEFAKGRVVKQWTEYQKHYLCNIPSPHFTNRWTQTLVTGLWDIYFQIWLQCNEALHSNEEIQNKVHKIHLIDHEIRQQWNISTQELQSADHKHFHNITLAQLLWKTQHYKQTWLQQVKSTITAIHKEEEDN